MLCPSEATVWCVCEVSWEADTNCGVTKSIPPEAKPGLQTLEGLACSCPHMRTVRCNAAWSLVQGFTLPVCAFLSDPGFELLHALAR